MVIANFWIPEFLFGFGNFLNIPACIIAALLILAFVFLQVGYVSRLLKLKKRIKYFLEHSRKENFEGIRVSCLELPKKVAILAIFDTAVSLFIDAVIYKTGVYSYLNLHFVRTAVFVVPLLMISAAVVIIGVATVKIAKKAEKLYRNLYPPIPTMQAYKQLNAEGVFIHDEEQLFETMDDGTASENINPELFGEKDPELIQYVEGGKSLFREETEVPIRGNEGELAACPLCGSLNSKTAVYCDFCGAELPKNNEESIEINLLEGK